jgi:hypothetical protein
VHSVCTHSNKIRSSQLHSKTLDYVPSIVDDLATKRAVFLVVAARQRPYTHRKPPTSQYKENYRLFLRPSSSRFFRGAYASSRPVASLPKSAIGVTLTARKGICTSSIGAVPMRSQTRRLRGVIWRCIWVLLRCEPIRRR